MKASLFLFSILLFSVYTSAQSLSKAEKDLLQANNDYDRALVSGDVSALDKIYSDEFIYTTPDGQVRDKAQQISFTRSGNLRLDTGRSTEVRIRIYGNTAVMTGRFNADGRFEGRPLKIDERYTAVWVKKKGKWRIVAEQGNFIKH